MAVPGHTGTSAVLVAALFAAACSASGLPAAPSGPLAPAESPPTPSAPTGGLAETVRYRVTFDARWSASTHPRDFPGAPHFSSLVGGTHNSAANFWREGAIASDGIRDMAERGRTSPLDQEIAAAVRAGTAERVLVGGGISASPGSISLDFEISRTYPLVTFVSMIAPSPDWFVGVSGVPLFEDGQWVGERRIDLAPWDAGTDSGSTFTSPDRETQPRSPISRILAAPLSPGGLVTPLGTFTFTRLTN